MDKEKLREAHKRWYLLNRERILARQREYRQENRGKINERNNAYTAIHIDQKRVYRHRYYLEHKEILRAQINENRKQHGDKYRAQARVWRKSHREEETAIMRQRRARLRGAVCSLTIQQWDAIKSAYQQRCAYCGKKVLLTQDHVIPLSKGGNHTPENVVPACRSCNGRKRTKILINPPPIRLML